MNRAKPAQEWDGYLLRRWRLARNVSVKRMARIVGVSPQAMYRFESGKVPPIDAATNIAIMTRGEIRYRDMYPALFRPEYA